MDVDMSVDTPTNAQGLESTADEPQNSENALRSNAIYIQGVDDLDTNDIEKFMVTYYNKPFQIEWINDSSLNIVYEDPEDAFQALVSMTSQNSFDTEAPIPAEQLRKLKSHPSKPEVELEARFAFKRDQKSSGSRAKSRFYLLHGEPSRKEDLARFGTKRSKPMIYGIRDKDIISKRRREAQVGDLFPSKAPTVSLDDDLMGDLLPQKIKSKKSRRRRKNKKSELPDLFASKTLESNAEIKPNEDTPADQGTSIYQNMDY